MNIDVFITFSAVKIYDLSFIHLYSSPSKAMNSQCDHLTVGLMAQLVDHHTGITDVIGSNPAQARIFFLCFNLTAA